MDVCFFFLSLLPCRLLIRNISCPSRLILAKPLFVFLSLCRYYLEVITGTGLPQNLVLIIMSFVLVELRTKEFCFLASMWAQLGELDREKLRRANRLDRKEKLALMRVPAAPASPSVIGRRKKASWFSQTKAKFSGMIKAWEEAAELRELRELERRIETLEDFSRQSAGMDPER